MSTPRKAEREDIRRIAAAWGRLRDETRIGVIRSDSEYERMVKLLDRLVDEVGDDETHPLCGLLDLVASLIERYEAANVVIPQAPAREVLRFLMHQHGLTQADLKPELGSQGVASEILSGKREINARQARALAARFGVSPSSFL
jgi:HTH-type transcriptional regulator / antitoxin HigA